MIRQPSTFSQLYAWHTAAVKGENPPQHDGVVHCGWFKRRMVKGGPWVPVRIFIERETDPLTGELTAPERFAIEVVGIREDDPAAHWSHLRPITYEEFQHLMDYRLRDSRMLDERSPIDLSLSPTMPTGVF